ncbi:MAG: ABC transporter permease subunit [Actinomycetota bacterium]|jgi:taurine transport system permease protein|nr:ABC transporter permease subunit [Actinomycetota bacterium]
MNADMGLGVRDGDTSKMTDKSGPFASWGMFSRGQDTRLTVAFGDSSAVRSLPVYSLISLVAMIVFWFVATYTWGFPDQFKEPGLSDKLRIAACNSNDVCKGSFSQLLGPLTFPSIRDTWNTFFLLIDEGFQDITLWAHTKASLWRVIRGMFFGTLFGVPIGFAMGLSSKARGFFDTIVESFRPVPPLALLPLFILIFGIGDTTAVRLLIFASIWIMIIASRSGVQEANLSKVRAAYSLGASKPQVLFRVLLPNALPQLFTGFRLALGVSWGTLVAAELVGTRDGLGSMIFAARPFFRLDVVVVGIIVIALLGVMMDIILRFLESKLIPWRGKG